jgi:hypothetical protein
MQTQIHATFIDGVLKPDEPLALPAHSRVRVTIESVSATSDPAAAWQSLQERIRQRPVHSGKRRYTRDELHERN